MALLVSPHIWSTPVRLIAFWGLTAIVTLVLHAMTAQMSLGDMVVVLHEASTGNIDRLGTRDFAFTLAAFLFALAGGLAVSFGLLHLVMISLVIGAARGVIERRVRSGDGAGFERERGALRATLGRHPIIGAAWRGFDDTLVSPDSPDGPARYTIRPQTILNANLARERLAGLKIMPSIPGYFVGIGLLLTFFGLVLALNEAAVGTTSNDAGIMRLATARLLQVATFKFATSIAGLGASIALSVVFRAYVIGIEAAFDRLCRAVELRMSFAAPQSITVAMNRSLAAQLVELRSLNGPAYSERLAVAITPPLQLAMQEAIAPLVSSIRETVAKLDATSRSGVEDLLKQFLEGVRGGAGTELRELGANLQTLQATLERTQQGLSGSGADFAARMAETSAGLNQLILQAGATLGQSSEASRAALAEMVGAMSAMFDRAHGQIEADLSVAAGGASARLEDSMGRVLQRLEAQVGGLQAGLGGFQQGMAQQMADSRQRALEAQESVLAMVDQAASTAAGVLANGFQRVVAEISDEVDRMVQSMRLAEIAMVAQATAVKDATNQSKAIADAFGRTADLVRTASGPLVQSSDRIAGASERMAETIGRSVAALDESQKAAKRLAENLTSHIDRLTLVWTGYETRFGKVDADLGAALEKLAEETRRQLEILAEHTVAIDKGLALAVDKLSGHVAGIAEGAGDLAESVEILRTSMIGRAAE